MNTEPVFVFILNLPEASNHHSGASSTSQQNASTTTGFLRYFIYLPSAPTEGKTAGAALLTVCEAAGVLTGVAAGVTGGLGLTDVGVALGVGERVGVALGVITGVGVVDGLQCLLWILGLSVCSSLQGLKSFSLSLWWSPVARAVPAPAINSKAIANGKRAFIGAVFQLITLNIAQKRGETAPETPHIYCTGKLSTKAARKGCRLQMTSSRWVYQHTTGYPRLRFRYDSGSCCT